MQTLSYVVLALKVAVLGGWVYLAYLLMCALRRPTKDSAVYAVRLLTAILGFGILVQWLILLVRQAALDGLLPTAIGTWSGWLWIEAPVSALLIVITVRLVQLMISQRFRALDEALRELRQLRSQVGTDPLTGLLNRGSLSRYLAEAPGTEGPFSVLFIDVDDFKRYNDSYGHLAGDDVLRDLAAILRQAVRHSDLVIRYGGEEFLLLLPGAGREVTVLIAEELRRTVAHHEFRHRRITLSVGAAEAPTDATDLRRLVELADQAMYQAKAHGGNRVYDSNGPIEGASRNDREGELLS